MISLFCVKTLARKEPTGQTKNLSEINCLHPNGITTFSYCLVMNLACIKEVTWCKGPQWSISS